MAVNYKETMWVEMTPNLYHGDKCNEVMPEFECYADGDMDSERGLKEVTFAANNFPPGTKIIVMEPTCPKCHQVPEMCNYDSCCDFDWDDWRDGKYS